MSNTTFSKEGSYVNLDLYRCKSETERLFSLICDIVDADDIHKIIEDTEEEFNSTSIHRIRIKFTRMENPANPFGKHFNKITVSNPNGSAIYTVEDIVLKFGETFLFCLRKSFNKQVYAEGK